MKLLNFGLVLFSTLSIALSAWASKPYFSFTFGTDITGTLAFEKLKVPGSSLPTEIYLVEFYSSQYGLFKRAIPESYFNESIHEFKKWNDKLASLGPYFANQNCGNHVVSVANNIKQAVCFENLNHEDKGHFMAWYRENVRIAKLAYGGSSAY